MAKKNHQLITNSPTERVALVIQYAGANLCGWQKQPFGRTVQSEIERAIAKFLGQHVEIYGAGRTDSGVHAAAQVAHFDNPSLMPAANWATAINNRLPDDILIRASAPVADNWHAQIGRAHV